MPRPQKHSVPLGKIRELIKLAKEQDVAQLECDGIVITLRPQIRPPVSLPTSREVGPITKQLQGNREENARRARENLARASEDIKLFGGPNSVIDDLTMNLEKTHGRN